MIAERTRPPEGKRHRTSPATPTSPRGHQTASARQSPAVSGAPAPEPSSTRHHRPKAGQRIATELPDAVYPQRHIGLLKAAGAGLAGERRWCYAATMTTRRRASRHAITATRRPGENWSMPWPGTPARCWPRWTGPPPARRPRHGRRTRHRGFDGYQGHIAIDLDARTVTCPAGAPARTGAGGVTVTRGRPGSGSSAKRARWLTGAPPLGRAAPLPPARTTPGWPPPARPRRAQPGRLATKQPAPRWS